MRPLHEHRCLRVSSSISKSDLRRTNLRESQPSRDSVAMTSELKARHRVEDGRNVRQELQDLREATSGAQKHLRAEIDESIKIASKKYGFDSIRFDSIRFDYPERREAARLLVSSPHLGCALGWI